MLKLGILCCLGYFVLVINDTGSVRILNTTLHCCMGLYYTRDVRKELLISIWGLQISSKPKSAHSMPSKDSPWLEMQRFNRCIQFLKASRYADLGTVIRY